MTYNDDELWVEKYRPKTIEDCVLPESLKATFEGMLRKRTTLNLLFCGSAGLGKTSVAKALCNDLEAECLFVNGSKESGIDVLRTKITDFATGNSMFGGKRVVLLDEADYLNANSTQPALRAFMEQFSANCSFILTCNYRERLIPEIHSRCSVIDFGEAFKKDKKRLQAEFFGKLGKILDAENVLYDRAVLGKVLLKYFPDFRRTIHELQRLTIQNGSINEGALSLAGGDFSGLFELLKRGAWEDLRQWAAENLVAYGPEVYAKVAKEFPKFITPETEGDAIILADEADTTKGYSADPELHFNAFCHQLLKLCVFK